MTTALRQFSRNVLLRKLPVRDLNGSEGNS